MRCLANIALNRHAVHAVLTQHTEVHIIILIVIASSYSIAIVILQHAVPYSLLIFKGQYTVLPASSHTGKSL